LQCLPNANFDDMVIPVGVTAKKDDELSFTSTTLHIPFGIKVFLEDKVANTFTRIDSENANYKVKISEDLNGIGRFYLHTSSKTLSVNDVPTATNISVFVKDRTNITVAGLNSENATLQLSNMLGKKVFKQPFKAKGKNTIIIPNLKTGIYIVSIQSDKTNFSKKIILK